uniref:SpaD n=1 Tax=Spirochaeta aurantia TaxID=147 RepID=Q0PI04_SPIAU|nr:SpaD [Spirochaeta aurantia]
MFIPVYNCSVQLRRVLQSLADGPAARFLAILVIDNLSQDSSASVALEFRARIPHLRVLQNVRNINLGGSHKVAFLEAERLGATHLAVLHGDDQAVVSELNGFLDYAADHPDCEAVLGSRFMKGSRLHGYDLKRVVGNRILNVFFTLFVGRPCRDLGSGLNLFRLSAFADHAYLRFEDAITFNVEILLALLHRSKHLKFLPITWRETDQRSNASNFRVAKRALEHLFRSRSARWVTPPTGRAPYDQYRELA